jgi:hypothetical protein
MAQPAATARRGSIRPFTSCAGAEAPKIELAMAPASGW